MPDLGTSPKISSLIPSSDVIVLSVKPVSIASNANKDTDAVTKGHIDN